MTCLKFLDKPSSCRPISNAPRLRNNHSFCEWGGFTKPHSSVDSCGIPTGPHQGAGPGCMGKHGVTERVFKDAVGFSVRRQLFRRQQVQSKSPATRSTASTIMAVRTTRENVEGDAVSFGYCIMKNWKDIIVDDASPSLGSTGRSELW